MPDSTYKKINKFGEDEAGKWVELERLYSLIETDFNRNEYTITKQRFYLKDIQTIIDNGNKYGINSCLLELARDRMQDKISYEDFVIKEQELILTK